jgi:membrane protease YdiL (CAAX protease family)
VASITTVDFLYLAIIAIGLFLDHFALWPAFLRRSQVNPASARLWVWSVWMSMLWALVAAGIMLWLYEARAWEALGLVVPYGWRLLSATGLALLLVVAYARTIAKIARIPYSRRVNLQNQFGKLAVVLPHTRSELGCFVALSLSAGFCEEFIFRGYLIWAFRPVLGLWGAAAISVIVFASAHAYQGAKGVLTSGTAGSLLTLVVLISESLLPAIALHALIDLGQGFIAWLIFRKVQGEGDAVAA